MKGGVSVGLTPDDDDRVKYGEFRFVVQTERPRDRMFNVATPPDERPTSSGVYWELEAQDGPDEPQWIASKYYGNVMLVWFTAVRELDERWQVLDEVLKLLKSSRNA